MPFNNLDYQELFSTLTDNFNILADEVQVLSDSKTILEHKLRFAHEQVSPLCFLVLDASHLQIFLYDETT
jgi:hypothetical protein